MHAKLILFLVLSCLMTEQLQAQESWQRIQQPRKARLLDVWSEERLLIIGDSNVHSLSSDGGVTWHDFKNSYQLSLAKITADSSVLVSEWHPTSDVYRVYNWASNDYGKSFSRVYDELHTYHCFKLCDVTPNDWYYGYSSITFDNPQVIVFGRSRNPRLDFDTAVVSIDIAGNIGMAMQPAGNALQITRDSGRSWESHRPPVLANFNSKVRSLSNGDWIIAQDSSLLRSVDTGNSWLLVLKAPGIITAIQFRDSLGLLSLANKDIMLMSSDYGQTWSATPTAEVHDINYVWIANDSVAYANGSAVIRTKNLKSRAAAILHTERIVDLGDRQMGALVDQTQMIYNLGIGDLIISSSTSNHASLQVSVSKSVIPAGDSAVININFRATQLPGDRATIDLVTNTPSQEERITLLAKVQMAGVESVPVMQNLTFAPNPSSGGLLSVVPAVDGLYRFSVRDALGREIASTHAQLVAGIPATLDLKILLSAGLYLVQVVDQDSSWVEKVIVR
jgi:photosystem II stability/assembly factor-like uncharacterized protein